MRILCCALLLTAALLVSVQPARAQQDEAQEKQQDTQQDAQRSAQIRELQRARTNAQRDLSKSQAAARAREQMNGRVLKVERRRDDYRVKMLQKSGRVISVDVDKNSGQVKQPTDKKVEQ